MSVRLDRKVDRNADRSVYKQIADHLRDLIESGALSAGDKLPSEAALMDHYEIARMTARAAVQVLIIEGLVEAVHGRGVFVTAGVEE